MVWRGTQRVGVAATRDRNGGVYVVARYATLAPNLRGDQSIGQLTEPFYLSYDPVGNWVGQRPY